MKSIIQLLLTCVLTTTARAEFHVWTRSDGKTAELELLSITTTGNEKSGVFKMRDGRSVTIKQSALESSDAKRLDDWKPAAGTATTAGAATSAAGGPSVFDKILDGNLLKLKGKSLKPLKDLEKPAKYYLFYYTASWCGPCHKFTPSLVEFYNKHKPADHDFELILITCDDDEKAMEAYAAELNMPWPQLKLAKAPKFKQEFHHPGGGIPNLVLTDLQGNLVKTSYEGANYVGPNVVMNHLETLLKK